MQRDAASLIGQSFDARYRIDALIARGGMATVYRGHDQRLNRPIAIKVLHPHLSDDPVFAHRFVFEAQQAARISHPNVVAVFDQGVDAGHAYIVMELVSGYSVRTLLQQVGRLTTEQTCALLMPIINGLAAAHTSGIVHRDLKPENILISDDGRVKIADFGLARAADQSASQTNAGLLIGTAMYLSPEYVDGQVADAQSDIYALGIITYELLTGQPPYSGDNPMQIALAHVRSHVPAPSSLHSTIPDHLDEFVLLATARDRGARLADAATCLNIIRLLKSQLPAAQPLPRPQALPRQQSDEDVTAVHERRTSRLELAPRKTSGPLRSGLRWLSGLLIVLGTGWWGWQNFVPAVVPNVTGQSVALAKAKLADTGFTAIRIARAYHPTIGSGLVISTKPLPGRSIRRSGLITVTVSQGIELTTVVDVTGVSVAEANRRLKEGRLKVAAPTFIFDETVSRGQVLGSTPTAGTRVAVGSLVQLQVSKGPQPIEISNLQGMSAESAASSLTAHGLKVVRTTAFHDRIARGLVIASNPGSGTLVSRGSTVTIVVSKGPPLVTVPNLFKMRESQAVASLKALGLKVKTKHPFGSAFGRVVKQSAKSGSRVARGATITLTVV